MTIETTLLEQAYVTEETVVPAAPTAALGTGAGNVNNGAHSYKVTYTSSAGESAPSVVSNTVTVVDNGVNGVINVVLPALVAGATGWKLYRSAAGDQVTGPWELVDTILAVDGVNYEDDVADGSLGAAAPTVSTASDGVFGYGVMTEPVATDGIRHQELSLDKKNNREPSPEKRGTPDRSQSLPRLTESTWELGAAFWEPSGTLGTPSYLTKLLRNGVGSRHIAALNTTVASGGSTTGATLTSVTGLAEGDLVVVTLPSGAREVTRVTDITGSVVTWDAISAAPANAAAVVAGVSYNLTNTHPTSLGLFKFHTAGGFKEALTGAVVNRMAMMFDGSREVGITFGGMGRDRVRTGFTQPGAHTTVGNPASGLIGHVSIDGASFLTLSAEVTIENNSALRKGEIGTQGLATGIMSHTDFRNVTMSLSFYLEDTTLFTKAETVTRCVVRLLIGDTNGAMVAMVCPNVEFEIPTIPTSGGPKVVTIEGVAYAGTLGNDSLILGEL